MNIEELIKNHKNIDLFSMWENPESAAFLNKLLSDLEDRVREILGPDFSRLNVVVEKCRWDSPELGLSWKFNEMSRNLVVLISGSNNFAWPVCITFSGAAWIDDWANHQRKINWKAPEFICKFSEERGLISTSSTLIRQMFDMINTLEANDVETVSLRQ